jgi:anti-repressor protein
MNELQIFENAQFGQVRTINKDGEPWFVGKDVAEALGYSNPRKALYDHVDIEDKTDGVTIRDSIGRPQNPVIINESGLYSLVMSSKLPNARQFKRWVTNEVLPNIRKNGGYIAGQETMTDDELLANALMVAQRKIEARDKQIEVQEKQIEAMHPKALFADAVSASKTSILIGDLAKLLKQNGVDIGQKRLFQWLRENKYLISQKGASYNSPTQRSMEMKLFEVKETTITHADGHITINRTAKVTGKGQVYFINKFVGNAKS